MSEDQRDAATVLREVADELYGLDLDDFTPARDAQVRALKGQGDLPKQVKALRKPSVAAWVVNLLVRYEAEQVDQVLTVGAALREAQASMSADELRALTRQRRQLTAAVTTRARALARQHGHKVSESVAEQVEGTLTAAMVDERCADAVRTGLLLAALSATGVDDVDVEAAVAVPSALGSSATPREHDDDPADAASGRPSLHVVPDPDADEKARAAAQEALDEAEGQLAAAQQELDDAAEAVAEVEARSLQVQSEIDELKRRLAELEETAEDVADELGDAEEAHGEAEAAVRNATRERDAARQALERLRR